MSNQTITTADRNLDDAAISGLLNGEDITDVANGWTLTINSDNRWSQQAAVLGNITINSGTGGTVRIDGRDVWWVPFDASTGNVPTLGTAGTHDCTSVSGATGEFLGVWTALGVAPSASGGAMPTTGFVKFRSVSAAFVDNDVVTLPGGATITVNSTTGGQRGWIHVVGEQASTITVPRLGLFEALGDWFELGTTDGNDNQTFQFPVADYCSAIQVETGVGTGVYEWWPSVGTTRWAQNNRVAQDTRGKVCNCTSAGVIQIALRGAVNNGYKPDSGCRVRVPNIFVSSTTSANWNANLVNVSGTSWDFTTTAAGALVFDKVCGNWYVSLSQPYSVTATDSAFQATMIISECATAPVVQRCCSGVPVNNDASPFSFTSCFAGGTVEDCVGFKYENESNDTGWVFTDCDGFTVSGCKTLNCADNTATTLNRGANTAYNMSLTRVTNSTVSDHIDIGGGFNLNGCVNVTISDYQYAECLENRTTNSTNAVYAVVMQGTTTGCVLEGPFANFDDIANIHPYNGLVNFLNAYDCEVRNIGTPAAPYDCGSANAMGVGVNFGGNDLRNIVRRVYLTNTRTGPIATLNSSSGGQAINVWGDYADATAIANLNFAFRGGRMAGSATGQTSVYGTHWSDHFNSATTGVIRIHANEPTAASAAECAETGGAPAFTSTGQVKLTTVGDQVTWTMPYFALGHTSLTTLTFTGTNSGNHTLEFQYDTGSGFSDWQTLDSTNLAGVGAINATTGIKLKVRATCSVAATANAITYLTINTGTDASSQQVQYPLPGVPVVVSVLDAADGSPINGARVLLLADTGGSLPANASVSITRSSSTATVTHTGHGFATNDKVVISGADQGEYNGLFQITVSDANTYTYTVSGSPATPATGTPVATAVVIDATTDVTGQVSNLNFVYAGSQPVVGRARKSSSAPYYRTGLISGTVASDGLSTATFLVSDD